MLHTAGHILLLCALLLPAVASAETMESIDEESAGGGGKQCMVRERVTTHARTGTYGYRHVVEKCGERSEFEKKKTKIGDTLWWAWSIYFPKEFESAPDAWDIVNQWGAYPSKPGRRYKCGGIGWKMAYDGKVGLRFDLQFAGKGGDECKQYAVLPMKTFDMLKGRWLDFVMTAKVTGNSDGYLKLWVRPQGRGYYPRIDYKGPTWWNDEGQGPYFKMGLYKGNPNFKGPPVREIFTDSYRLGRNKKDVVIPPLGK